MNIIESFKCAKVFPNNDLYTSIIAERWVNGTQYVMNRNELEVRESFVGDVHDDQHFFLSEEHKNVFILEKQTLSSISSNNITAD